jgi:hypothetical protein
MSSLGHFQPIDDVCAMSAFAPIATELLRGDVASPRTILQRLPFLPRLRASQLRLAPHCECSKDGE